MSEQFGSEEDFQSEKLMTIWASTGNKCIPFLETVSSRLYGLTAFK